MLAIKNNLMADVAARQLGKSYDSLSQSVERLSSGLRINGSRDDAAGLAVRELIRADIATLRQGSRNGQDAISMLQTSEGAMGVVDDILIRMSELATQASTESYSSAQRSIMDQEFQQLAAEIDRIAGSTKFNGIGLLDSSAAYSIHVGDTTSTVSFSAQVMTTSALGLSTTATSATSAYVMANTGAASAGAVWLTSAMTSAAAGANPEVKIVLGKLSAGDTNMSATAELTSGTQYTISAFAAAVNADADGELTASVVYNSAVGSYFLKVRANDAGALTTSANFAVTAAAELTPLNSASQDWAFTAGADATSADVSISTVGGAQSALSLLTSAIEAKDTYRARLGYMMNRLEAATNVVDVQAENLLAAESRISDVDVATEMASLTRNQVLAQAGISMLSQANMMPQMALSLLG